MLQLHRLVPDWLRYNLPVRTVLSPPNEPRKSCCLIPCRSSYYSPHKELGHMICEAHWDDLSQYEQEDYTVSSQELACVAGACEI